MKPETNLQTLDFVDTVGQTLSAAQKLAEKAAQEEEKIATIVPPLVDNLLATGNISSQEKQAAASQLETHEGALAIVSNLVKMSEENKQSYEQKLAAAGPGHSVPNGELNGKHASSITKSADAGVDYSDGGYIGRRRGLGEKSAADLSFERALRGGR